MARPEVRARLLTGTRLGRSAAIEAQKAVLLRAWQRARPEARRAFLASVLGGDEKGSPRE
jgi:hypothetical protein